MARCMLLTTFEKN